MNIATIASTRFDPEINTRTLAVDFYQADCRGLPEGESLGIATKTTDECYSREAYMRNKEETFLFDDRLRGNFGSELDDRYTKFESLIEAIRKA